MSKFEKNKMRSEIYHSKKVDANGKQLKENIGKGLNIKQVDKIEKERLTDFIKFRVDPKIKIILFNNYDNPSEMLRVYVNNLVLTALKKR